MEEKLLKEYFETFYLRLTGINMNTLAMYEKLTFISQQLNDLLIEIKRQREEKNNEE